MEYLLQILGSIASIGSIPLAVYLYFRSREAKHTKARQEIVRIISFQVGEGRRLSTFEIRAVIDSKIRESRIRENSITVNEIIEDLVSETIMSPMLESQRKAEIIENLRSIHERSALLGLVDKYPIDFRNAIRELHAQKKIPPEESELALSTLYVEATKKAITLEKKRYETISSTFALIAFVVTIIAFLISIVSEKQIMEGIFGLVKGGSYLFDLVLGVLGTLLSVLLTYLFYTRQRRMINIRKAERNRQKE